jgi:hypothetical protein
MNLIERLRNSFEVGVGPDDAYAAADEIERLREKLRVAEEALEHVRWWGDRNSDEMLNEAMNALAKIREE